MNTLAEYINSLKGATVSEIISLAREALEEGIMDTNDFLAIVNSARKGGISLIGAFHWLKVKAWEVVVREDAKLKTNK